MTGVPQPGEMTLRATSSGDTARIPLRMTRYEVVPYSDEFQDTVIDISRFLSPDSLERRRAYFQWKFLDNPYVDPMIYLAKSGDRVVGMRAFSGTKWEVDGSEYMIPCATNLVVLPEHRQRGIVRQIMEVAHTDLARRGFPIAINLSARPITHIASLSMGWRGAGPLEDVRRGTISDPRPRPGIGRVQRRVQRLWRRAIGYAKRRVTGSRPPFKRFDQAVVRSPRHGIAVDRYPWADSMAGLVKRLPYDGRLRHVRDPQYLEWRYRNPLSDYRFVYRQQHGVLEGYLVIGTKAREHAPEVEAYIVDWEASSAEVRAALLEAVLDWDAFEALAVWQRCFDASVRALLARHGFETTETDISITSPRRTVLMRPLGRADRQDAWTLGGRSLLEIGNWDVRMIYSDGF